MEGTHVTGAPSKKSSSLGLDVSKELWEASGKKGILVSFFPVVAAGVSDIEMLERDEREEELVNLDIAGRR